MTIHPSLLPPLPFPPRVRHESPEIKQARGTTGTRAIIPRKICKTIKNTGDLGEMQRTSRKTFVRLPLSLSLVFGEGDPQVWRSPKWRHPADRPFLSPGSHTPPFLHHLLRRHQAGRRLIYSFVPFLLRRLTRTPYFQGTLCKKAGWAGCLRRIATCSVFTLLDFPPRPRLTFSFRLPHTQRPPFLRSSNGRKSGEAVSFRGRRPWKNPPFRRAFCKKANFSTQMLEARNHRGTTYRRDHLLTSSSPSPSPRPKFRLSLSLSSSAEYRTCPYTWSRTAGFRRIGSPAIRVMDSVSVCSIRACQYAHAFSGIRARAWPPRGPRNSIPFCRQDVRPPLISRRVKRI